MNNYTIIDGKKCSEIKRLEIKEFAQIFYDECGYKPRLAIILIGDNPASVSYVKGKHTAIEECFMESLDIHYPEDTTEDVILNLINGLNNDPTIHGILVQLPLPKHLNEDYILSHIKPEKDVDGIVAENMGKMLLDKEFSFDYNYLIPCTPKGILYLLEYYKIETENKNVVVIGRSNIVGKPIANLLLKNSKFANSNVTVIHSKTKDIKSYTLNADILIAAVGKPNLITLDMIKEGCVVIDVGVNRIPSTETKSGYKLVGDCDFESMKEMTSYITPVPGGVGPMTITMLLDNLIQASFFQTSKTDKIKKLLGK